MCILYSNTKLRTREQKTSLPGTYNHHLCVVKGNPKTESQRRAKRRLEDGDVKVKVEDTDVEEVGVAEDTQVEEHTSMRTYNVYTYAKI